MNLQRIAVYSSFLLLAWTTPYPSSAQTHYPCDTPQRIDFVQITPAFEGLLVQTLPHSDYLRSDAALALMDAADRASREGYTIIIQSACRPYKRQVQLARKGRGSTIALPGQSRHGYGIAVDATLGDARGRDLIGLNMHSHLQCSLGPDKMQYVKKLCKYFFAAGWKRLPTETWHFEYDQQSNRLGTCAGFASLCSKRGLGDCLQHK